MEHQLLHSSATKYDQDLGVLLSEYSNSEYKFNLWYILILLIPIIGIIIFLILLINFLLSRYPSKTYQLYENGFVVKNKKIVSLRLLCMITLNLLFERTPKYICMDSIMSHDMKLH